VDISIVDKHRVAIDARTHHSHTT